MSDELNVQLILTTGGTGFSPRDITPEVTRKIIQREAPQLSLAMSLESFKKTKFAALSRAVCGIRNQTLIVNLPGSPKAVEECFMAIVDILNHAIDLIVNRNENVAKAHGNEIKAFNRHAHRHICPHKTGTGSHDDRNSPFPMISVDQALKIILDNVKRNDFRFRCYKSPINIPEFRASIKDGYAVKANGSCRGVKKVLGYVSAGEDVVSNDFDESECYKINTGAAVPHFADAIVQVEDTKLLKSSDGREIEVEIMTEPSVGLDIR